MRESPMQSRAHPLILLVDDEAHILHVLKLKLSNAGYEIMTAEDGEEALELALAHLPDLVITDFQMPFMSGLELCMKLREDQRTRQTPALMLTARGFTLNPQDLDCTNISAVISKPFSPREVLATVQGLVRQRDEQEAASPW
jgi:two-component system, OmpR family, alkaline phosphatase synthesis response regulator PhoP